MKIFFDKLYKDDRTNELCGICVPFAKGSLPSDQAKDVIITDGNKVIPLQTEVTSLWEDGSVRYAYLNFLADLPGNAGKELELKNIHDVDRASADKASAEKAQMTQDEKKTVTAATRSSLEEKNKVKITEDSGNILISNGALCFSVKNDSSYIFDDFKYNDISFSKEQFEGPFVRIDGSKLKTVYDSWEVVKSGEILSVVQGSGRCIPDNETAFSGEGIRFEMRILVTAGKPWLDMGFRFINCTDGDIKPDDIIFAVKTCKDAAIKYDSPVYAGIKVDSTGCGDTKGMSKEGDIVTTTGIKDLPDFDIIYQSSGEIQTSDSGCIQNRSQNPKSDNAGTSDFDHGIRTLVARSNYRTEFKISRSGECVENTIIAEMLEKEANEHFAEVLYGTFMADYTDPQMNVGVCATVFQAFQNFPKAVRSDKNGITVFIIPDQEAARDTTKASPVVFTSGMARETRFLLHFHDATEPIYELDNRSLIYQMPDRPYIDPMEFARASVMPDIFLSEKEQIDDVEIALIEKADSHARCYGMLNFGDAPDPGYTAQGRGGGNLVWTNNEYDYPHAMFMMYARSGIRRFLDYALAAARHWMDVDVCHYSSNPLRMGGQWEHTRRHTGGSEEGRGCTGEMVCSHEWVEGLLDLYHFTSDERALKTALGIGENVLRLLDTPMYQTPGEASARETGWALRTLTALFLETHDEKWTDKCRWILSQFELWNGRYGNWLAPYTDNTTIRVGFMISVAVGSLMRYYRAFPDDELKKMILGAIDDLTENFMTRQGLFLYKELPSLSRNGTNTLLLEAMAIGYELTGDTRYLEFGKKTFERAINTAPASIGGKKIIEDTVMAGSGAPKNFAQSFYPITAYYVQTVKAGF